MVFEEEARSCKRYMQQDFGDKKHFLLQLGDVIRQSEVLKRYWIELVEGIIRN